MLYFVHLVSCPITTHKLLAYSSQFWFKNKIFLIMISALFPLQPQFIMQTVHLMTDCTQRWCTYIEPAATTVTSKRKEKENKKSCSCIYYNCMFSKTSHRINKSKSYTKKENNNLTFTHNTKLVHIKKEGEYSYFSDKNTFHYRLYIIRSNNSNAYKVKTIPTKQIVKTNKNKNTLSLLKINQIKCMSFGMCTFWRKKGWV